MSEEIPDDVVQQKWDPDDVVRKEWELSYYVVGTEKEVAQIYDAIQTILCTCEFPREKDDCRVPVSGMHLHRIDALSGDRISLDADPSDTLADEDV